MEPITGHYVMVEGTRTYFEVCGEGIPVICIHTACADNREYRFTLPTLSKHGFQVFAPDLPGHGKSYPVNWEPISNLHTYAEFIWAFAQTLNLEKPIILGCSIGADIAIDLAVHHSPELRACIALEGAAHTPTFPDTTLALEPHSFLGWETVLEYGSTSSLGPDCDDEKVIELKWIHKSCAQKVGASDLIGWSTHNVLDKLDQITVPLLIARGTADFYVPEYLIDQTVERVPTATKVILDNLGHYPMYEDPERINAIIIDFLKTANVI